MLAYVYIRKWLNIVVCVSCACARINFVICNSIYIITRIPYSYTFRGVAGLPLWLDKTANDKLMIVREEAKSTLCRQTKKFWSIWCIHACSMYLVHVLHNWPYIFMSTLPYEMNWFYHSNINRTSVSCERNELPI